jgi:hypothetical protein
MRVQFGKNLRKVRAGLPFAIGETDSGPDLNVLSAVGREDASQDDHSPTGRVEAHRHCPVFTEAAVLPFGAPVGVCSRVGHG